MFTSMIETARKSPFSGPITRAECAAPAKAVAANTDSCEFGSTKFFMLCGVGGIVSCGKCELELNDDVLWQLFLVVLRQQNATKRARDCA